jgi:predicted AAA+ superfamily ATPase
VYFCDTGVRNALINNFSLSGLRSDIGQLFENYVIAEFYKLNQLDSNAYNMRFWQNRNGSEVDLVLVSGEALYPYEMKWGENRKSGLAFTNEYQIVPIVINRANAAEYFMSLYNRQLEAIPGVV